jgi:hypothetical protein
MRKLLFFLAVWKRPEITEICFMGLDRLKKSTMWNVDAFAVISEESMIPLCERYGVKWVMHDNLPLGKKKNFGLSEALKEDFDYLVEIGSDDIFKNEFLNLYTWDRDVFALADFVMLNTQDGECRRLSKHHAYYGTGRAISKKALLQMGPLWKDKLNHGLDNDSTFALAKKGFLEKRVPSEPVVIGLKSEVNIWPFEKKGSEYPLEKALEGLSDQEVNAIRCLIQNKTLASLTEG